MHDDHDNPDKTKDIGFSEISIADSSVGWLSLGLKVGDKVFVRVSPDILIEIVLTKISGRSPRIAIRAPKHVKIAVDRLLANEPSNQMVEGKRGGH